MFGEILIPNTVVKREASASIGATPYETRTHPWLAGVNMKTALITPVLVAIALVYLTHRVSNISVDWVIWLEVGSSIFASHTAVTLNRSAE